MNQKYLLHLWSLILHCDLSFCKTFSIQTVTNEFWLLTEAFYVILLRYLLSLHHSIYVFRHNYTCTEALATFNAGLLRHLLGLVQLLPVVASLVSLGTFQFVWFGSTGLLSCSRHFFQYP